MDADSIKIECEEDGFWLVAYTEGVLHCRCRIADPEALYDHVKAVIGPWLRERDAAHRETAGPVFGPKAPVYLCNPDESADAYEWSDPKHPDFHSVHVDIYDQREGK